MKAGQHLEQQTTMRMALAPQQVQFMRLLEMSGPALEEEVQRQVDDNPALEIVEPLPATLPNEDVAQYDMKDPDDDPADYLPATSKQVDRFSPVYADDSPYLYDFLTAQLGLTDLDDRQHTIAEYIIGNIDDDGFLTRKYDDIADDILINSGIDCTPEEIESVAKIVQSFDPPGVGATDIWQSLRIQLQRISNVTPAVTNAREIVGKYSEMLSRKHYDRLRAKLGIDRHSLDEALEVIHHLNPRPGQAVSITNSDQKRNHITPDASIDIDDGRVSISLINYIPALQIEQSFDLDTSELQSTAKNKHQQEATAFIKAKRDEAETFISALKQRSNTLFRVTEAIVRFQKDFFLTGDESRLRPMILEDIKALTDLDVSVISRATKDKYMETVGGTYPYKKFFNEAPTDNPDLSAHKIKDEIRKIVDSEDKRSPLSDVVISENLKKKGLNIARRTVTKYRKEMGIADSRLRKS